MCIAQCDLKRPFHLKLCMRPCLFLLPPLSECWAAGRKGFQSHPQPCVWQPIPGQRHCKCSSTVYTVCLGCSACNCKINAGMSCVDGLERSISGTSHSVILLTIKMITLDKHRCSDKFQKVTYRHKNTDNRKKTNWIS